MRRYWFWIATMAVLAVLGSYAVRAIAFAMLPDAAVERYGGFHVGLSLPIPVVQIAPHWYAIIAVWCMLAHCAAGRLPVLSPRWTTLRCGPLC